MNRPLLDDEKKAAEGEARSGFFGISIDCTHEDGSY
jgi:hypothetical protein